MFVSFIVLIPSSRSFWFQTPDSLPQLSWDYKVLLLFILIHYWLLFILIHYQFFHTSFFSLWVPFWLSFFGCPSGLINDNRNCSCRHPLCCYNIEIIVAKSKKLAQLEVPYVTIMPSFLFGLVQSYLLHAVAYRLNRFTTVKSFS